MTQRESHIPGSRTTTLAHDRAQIDTLETQLFDEIERLGFSTSSQFAIRLAFEEAITNAFIHGNKGLENSTITVEYMVQRHRVSIAIEDLGTGFDPSQIPDPTLEENLHKPSGRGLMLIKSYMNKVWHNDRGNTLMMCYEPANGKA